MKKIFSWIIGAIVVICLVIGLTFISPEDEDEYEYWR